MNDDALMREADPIVRYSELRKLTDYSIDSSLSPAALASWILWAFYLTELRFRPISNLLSIPLSLSLSIIGLPAFVATIPVAYLVYLIVNRRNEHFSRSEALLRAAIERVKNGTSPTDIARMSAINSAERDLLGSMVEEKERSAYLWS